MAENPLGLSNYAAATNPVTINNVQSIDDQPYYVSIWLYNQITGQDPFQIPYIIIDSLSIEETLSDWNTKGWVVINNHFEIIEKYFPGTTKAPTIFRTDGRNRLRLQLCPIIETSLNFKFSTSLTDSGVSDEVRKKWEICLDCVIYDIEDVEVPNSIYKKKKLYFYDERYQIFSEKNIEWSTAVQGRREEGLDDTSYSTKGGTPTGSSSIISASSGAKDVDRACSANSALKSLIKEAGKDPAASNGHIKVGGGTIDAPTNEITTDPSTDVGWYKGTSDNNILYTSPAYSSVNDDIDYVLNFCGSKEKGPCFLNITRWENPSIGKVFQLYTLKDYFDEVKRNEQVEHLIIEDSTIENNLGSTENAAASIQPYVPKAPNSESTNIKNFVSGRASIIKSYRFSPMVSSDDDRISTTPLHQFDFATGTFKIQFTDNKINDVYDSMTTYAKDTLYSFTNSDAHVLLNINKTKNTGVMLKNHFESLQIMPKFLPQTNMVRDSLFLNECISFIVAGLTIRSPGRFIFIDKLSSTGDPNPFDDRFLGQWLIIKVVHLFAQGQYISEVTATKVDTFRKLWDKEDSQ